MISSQQTPPDTHPNRISGSSNRSGSSSCSNGSHPDFSFLNDFSSASELDDWMREQQQQQQQCLLPFSHHHHHPRVGKNTTATSLTRRPPNFFNWTSREEVAFVHAMHSSHTGYQYRTILFYCSTVARHSSVHLYTAALSAVSSNVGRHAENDNTRKKKDCMLTLDSMDERNIRPSSYTLKALFTAYCDSYADACFLAEHVKDRYPSVPWTEHVWEAAIHTCSLGGHTTASPSNTMDSGTVWRRQAWDAAHSFYADFLQAVPERKPVLLERIHFALFHVAASTQNINAFLSVLDSILNMGVRVSPRLWAAILKVCVDSRAPRQAFGVLKRMSGTGLRLNVRHCTAYLKALIGSGKLYDAAKFLVFMAGKRGFDERSSTELPNQVADSGGAYADLCPTLSVDAPDMVAVKTVLNGCAKMGNYTLAREILSEIKTGGFGEVIQQQLDEQCYNFVLSSCRDPNLAKELIREMRLSRRYRVGVIPPSKVTLTKAISICRKAKDIDNVLFFLDFARNDGIDPDESMYTTGTQKDDEQCMMVQWAMKILTDPLVFIAIWTAAESNNSISALELFSEMKSCNCTPTIASYNAVLVALGAAGRIQDMVTLFRDIKIEQPSIVTDFLTFSCLAGSIQKAASDEEQLALLWRVYASMTPRERHVDVGGRLIEAIIGAYGVLGHFDEAMSVFASIQGPSDSECLRAILFACSFADPPQWKIALSLLHASDIVTGGEGPALVEPGALCNTMLACSKANEWEESLQLFRLYGRESTPIAALNSLIASCGRKDRADMSIDVLLEIEEVGLMPDQRTYRNAIIACNNAEHAYRRSLQRLASADSEKRPSPPEVEWWERACWLLRRMKSNGLKPDTPTISSAISACEAAGQWQVALEILQSAMDDEDRDKSASNSTLSLYCFNAAIAACEKGKAWIEALEIYELMKDRGGPELRPNIVTLSSLVQSLDTAGQKELALSIYEEGVQMKAVKDPWRFTTNSTDGEQIYAMDLHSCSAAMARAAIRSHVEELLSAGSDLSDFTRDWIIIVGKGLRTQDFPVLKRAVCSLLQLEYGIIAITDERNDGRLIVSSETLRRFVAKMKWG